jgi:hypothetical protein
MASTSAAARNAAVNAATALLNGGFARIYSGTPPANADAALSGNTQLAEGTLGTPAFGGASAGAAAANAVGQDASNDATGSPSFVRLVTTGGAAIIQGLASIAWVASTAYVVGDRVANGGNQYRCTVAGTSAGSGGPSGTGGAIVDGGATWAFEGAVEGLITNTGGPRIVAGGTFSISAITYTLPAG